MSRRIDLVELFGGAKQSSGGTIKLGKDAMRALAQVISAAVDSNQLGELAGWAGGLLDSVAAAADRGISANVRPPPNVWKPSQTMQKATDTSKRPEKPQGGFEAGLPPPKSANVKVSDGGVGGFPDIEDDPYVPSAWKEKPSSKGVDVDKSVPDPGSDFSTPSWLGGEDLPKPKASGTPFSSAKTKSKGPTDYDPPKISKLYDPKIATRAQKPSEVDKLLGKEQPKRKKA